jgi:hypothetical protein
MAEWLKAAVLKTESGYFVSASKFNKSFCEPAICAEIRVHLISLDFTVFERSVVTN